MRFFDHFKAGGFTDPSTLQGAVLFAVVFAFFAWLFGHDADLDKARAILLDLGSKHPKATQVCGCPLTILSARTGLFAMGH